MATSKCDGAGSNGMGVAHHGERSVLGSMLVLGRTSWYLIGRRCRSLWHALEQCNGVRPSSGSTERYACIGVPQRVSSTYSRHLIEIPLRFPAVVTLGYTQIRTGIS
jgi:hypothetical protein